MHTRAHLLQAPPQAISLCFIRSPLPFTASSSPSASIAQELTLSSQLPSYRPGFVCSSQLPPTRTYTSTRLLCDKMRGQPPTPFHSVSYFPLPSVYSILPLLSSPPPPLLSFPSPPLFLISFSFLLLSLPYVAAPSPAIASAPSCSLVTSALSAISLVQSTSSMPSAPTSEPSTISSISSLIFPPAQRAPALPHSAMIVSPSLPPVPAKAVEKIVKHQFVEMKKPIPDNSALMLQLAALGPNQRVSSGKLRKIDDPLIPGSFIFFRFWPSLSSTGGLGSWPLMVRSLFT